VALLCPDRAALSRLGAKLGKTGSVEELVADKYVPRTYVLSSKRLCLPETSVLVRDP
jgi:hypothetical protein